MIGKRKARWSCISRALDMSIRMWVWIIASPAASMLLSDWIGCWHLRTNNWCYLRALDYTWVSCSATDILLLLSARCVVASGMLLNQVVYVVDLTYPRRARMLIGAKVVSIVVKK